MNNEMFLHEIVAGPFEGSAISEKVLNMIAELIRRKPDGAEYMIKISVSTQDYTEAVEWSLVRRVPLSRIEAGIIENIKGQFERLQPDWEAQ